MPGVPRHLQRRPEADATVSHYDDARLYIDNDRGDLAVAAALLALIDHLKEKP